MESYSFKNSEPMDSVPELFFLMKNRMTSFDSALKNSRK